MKHHYKKILIAFFFSMQFSFLNAQWVTIPDWNFVNYLQSNFPACMNGNLMDTTCSDILNTWNLWPAGANISNLEGVQYFDNLWVLDCTNNLLDSLPVLPGRLRYLWCSTNNLTKLPYLPDTLESLACAYNPLDTIPQLPSTLKSLACGGSNLLTTLPILPNSLTSLGCVYSPNLNLPANLPDSLRYFRCNNNQFTSLPALPDSLKELYCEFNQLASLPALPPALENLDCSENVLTSLPPLSSTIWNLQCFSNQLTSVPALPDSLTDFVCNDNLITGLPSLPAKLYNLICYNNQITSLPNLPGNLSSLWCQNNQLSSLPALPGSLDQLTCQHNQLTSLPELPDTIVYCYADYNPSLTCLPELKVITGGLAFTNTAITCVPNYGIVANSIPPLSSLPLCDSVNSNGCLLYYDIAGKVYSDSINNCIKDSSEISLVNLKIQLFSGLNLLKQTYSTYNGFYSFKADTGTYTYTVDTTDLPVLVTCPVGGFQTSVFTALDSMDYGMDFGMECKPGFDVGATTVARDSGVFRQAHFARVKISAGDVSNFYGLHCAAGTGGSVQVVFSGAVSYVGATAGALTPVVSGDTLLYSITDFGMVNFNSDFSFTMQTDTTAPMGSQVCFDVNVTPTAGDVNPANNSFQHCFTVVNSIDPNIKEVFPEGNIDTSQHWLTYTVNFQNTGTAPAQHIYVLDTLDNNLNESSFTLLSYSHQPLTQVMGKVIRFNFPNINLADSTSDEPHSHGYVQFKVKLKAGLTNGTLIHNTANIYFDFNSPVTTNTTENQILITTSVKEFGVSGLKFEVVPNPFHTTCLLKIISPMKSGNYNLEIYNVIGEKVKEIKSVNKNEIVIERNNLEAGIYIFKLFVGNELKGTGKLVIQ